MPGHSRVQLRSRYYRTSPRELHARFRPSNNKISTSRIYKMLLSPYIRINWRINQISYTSDTLRFSRKWTRGASGKLGLGTSDLCSYNNISLLSCEKVARQQFKASSRDGNRPTNDEILQSRRDSDKNSRKLFSLDPMNTPGSRIALKVYRSVYRIFSLCLNSRLDVHGAIGDSYRLSFVVVSRTIKDCFWLGLKAK